MQEDMWAKAFVGVQGIPQAGFQGEFQLVDFQQAARSCAESWCDRGVVTVAYQCSPCGVWGRPIGRWPPRGSYIR